MSSLIDIVILSCAEGEDVFQRLEGDLLENIKSTHINQEALHFLQNIFSVKYNKIEIEYPYADRDYLSSVYKYYIKSNTKIDKYSYRLHLYRAEVYFGYVVLRPTPSAHIGRIQMNPSAFLAKTAQIVTSTKKANIIGEEKEIEYFPYINQDMVVSMCAHCVTWAVAQFSHQASWNNFSVALGDIMDKTQTNPERKMPVKGLETRHIMEVLSETGLHPCLFERAFAEGLDVSLSAVFSYLNSGIPVIGLIKDRRHAISLIGYTVAENVTEIIEEKPIEVINDTSNLILEYKLFQDCVIHDDNNGPYRLLPIESVPNLRDTESEKYSFESIRTFIVPLPEKIYAPFDVVYEKTVEFVSLNPTFFPKIPIISIALEKSNRLKTTISTLKDQEDLKECVCLMQMPSYVWKIEVSSPENYIENKMDCILIFDATAHPGSLNPWLLKQLLEHITFFDDIGEEQSFSRVNKSAYPRFCSSIKEYENATENS